MNLIVLAAGKGQRMKMNKPKWMVEIFFKPMINYIENITDLFKKNIIVVKEDDKEYLRYIEKFDVKFQKDKIGSAAPLFNIIEEIKEDEDYLIMPCDIPLISKKTIEEFISKKNDKTLIMSSTLVENTSYGSLVKDSQGNYIIDNNQKASNINVGFYIIKGNLILKYLPLLEKDNNEYNLTNLINKISENEGIELFKVKYNYEILNINSLKEVNHVNELLKKNINKKHIENGVYIVDENSTFITDDVTIESGTTIYPNTFVLNNVKISKNCAIGPFARIINETIIEENCVIGNYVEIKNSLIGKNTNIKHHAYVGDAIIKENVNIGAGVITANYNGKIKSKTTIGSNTFIGSNTTLVAPINIGNNCFVAAGVTLRKDLADEKFIKIKEKYKIKRNIR